MYKNILIATDGSDFARTAVDHGLKLAKTMGASVTVLTVTETWSALEMAQKAKIGTTNPIEDYEASAAGAAAKILEVVEEQAKSLGLKYKTIHIKDKHPAEGIIGTADSGGADLIVMASHGRRGLQKILLGSVAAEVLTYSKVPVLVVKKTT
jgi:nucleotide-binding universal stress UspA family protein